MKKNSFKRLMAAALCLCMLLSLYVPSVSAETVSYHDMTMSQILALDEDLTWVFTGDSITHNGSWTGGYNDYAAWFEQYLYDIGRGDDSLINTAWGGADIQDFLFYSDTSSGQGAKADPGMGLEQFVTKYNPDVVFIKLGMNNRTMTDAKFAELYNKMLDGIYSEGAKNGKVPKIILLSPTPLSGESGISSGEFGSDPTAYGYYDSVKRFSVNLSNIAAQRGLLFVDLRQAFVDESAVLGDRYQYTFFSDPSDGLIHPNAAGQYFMFKTICKTLGLYNASMPIFQVSYDNLTEAPLYNDNTSISYTGSYGSEVTDSDDDEMDKTMPELEQNTQPVLLASADFSDSNGTFTENDDSYVDLTKNENGVNDVLTLEEVKTLEKEFSIVFRAKLNEGPKPNQAIFYLSSTGFVNWNDALAVGAPSTSNEIYYQYRINTKGMVNGGGRITLTDAYDVANDSLWHTIAIVQEKDCLYYYVDGNLEWSDSSKYLNENLSKIFESADAIYARIGNYGSGAKGYFMDGSLDYWQLYKGALSADEVAHLTDNSGAVVVDEDQMNKTMPTISGVEATASVDFTSTNGSLDFDEKEGLRIDTETDGYAINTLTQAEAEALGTEFTVVMNAKLNSTYQTNQPVLFVSSNGTANWQNALVVGVPAKVATSGGKEYNNQLYYKIMSNSTDVLSKSGQINLTGDKVNGDGKWHTIAVAVKDGTITFYVDGVQIGQGTGYGLKEGYSSIGSLFQNSTDYAVQIGRYGTAKDGTGYKLKGDFNYWQFYSTALTADQLKTLTVASYPSDAEEMNATMPKLPTVEKVPSVLASVDFTSENGEFIYNNSDINASTLDLTVNAEGVDTLTLAEAKTMGKEYTVVFRAKLNPDSSRANQPILYLAGTSTGGFSAQTDKVLMGMPGTSNIYYQVYKDGKSVATLSGATTNFGNLRTDMNDGEWHTIAIVQSATGLTYYVDGTAYPVTTNDGAAITISTNIGEMFADTAEADFDAAIGRYGITDKNWKTQGDFDFWQLYDGALTADQIKTLTVASDAETSKAAEWSDIVVENSLWAVVGADQMSGYLGQTPNFSLFRLLNNGIRGGGNTVASCRDIRLLNLAKPGQTMSEVADNYDDIIGEHKSIYDVLIVLPELPDIYSATYIHGADLVAAYKADVQKLVDNNKDKTVVLWSPLASPDTTINGYIDEYAAAVREIANSDAGILFFDANKFMNEKLAANGTLSYNWFDDSMHITPLCATDLAYAFYTHAGISGSNKGELSSHNLRVGTDARTYKNGYMKDNLSYSVSVSGGSFTVDASGIAAAYPGITNLRVAVVPDFGTGSPVEPWILGSVGESLTAPYSNPVITVYGDYNGLTYRFKDVSLSLTTGSNQTAPYTETADLTALEVVGAPAIGFDPSKTTYDVELYQYQQQVRIVAEGGDNLTIQVNGQTVKPGDFSQYIAVDSTATVTVTVTGGAADKTYTLNLVRPDYPDIIITEIMTDGYGNYTKSGADNYDLIEIYNASGRDLNLLDYSIGYIREYVYTSDQAASEIPYYFTGNDQRFFNNTHLGINQITKYSSYWADKVDQEPEEVIFPADSAMVIWVKFSKDSGTDYGSSLTYETLINALEAHSGTHTLTVDVEENGETVTKTIVPSLDQLVVAEIPYGAAQSNVTNNITTTTENFYLDNFGAQNTSYSSANRRGWLFVLDDSAKMDYYGALTEAGDDIISAARYVRVGSTNKLSSVLQYNVSRGLSAVKDPSYWDSNFTTGHTSDQQGYANLTSFGAVEYWQKPYDLADTTLAVIDNQTPEGVLAGEDAQIKLNITDNEDIRYIELYVDADNDGTYETVIKKDITLITSATNEGVAKDVTAYTLTHDLTDLTDTVKYYGFVLDGNNNKTEIGTAQNPKVIEIVQANQLKVTMTVNDVNGAETTQEIEVEIKLSRGSSPSALAASYTVKNSKGETVGTIIRTTDNVLTASGTVKVVSGDYLTIDNLPTGSVYEVSVTVPEGYEDLTDAKSYAGNIGFDGVVHVILKEKLVTGDLTVNASVTKEDGTSAGETTTSVKIELVKDASSVELAESYEVVYGSENKTAATQNGSVTLNLADGETAVVKGLPVGTKYTVTVIAPAGYEDTTTGSTSGNMTAAGATVSLTVQKTLVTGDLTVGASVKTVDGSESTAKVTVKIDLTKGSAPVAPDGSYEVVDAEGTKLGTVQNGTVTVELSDGQKAIVKDVPAGVEYALTVTAPARYEDVTETALTGSITENGAIAAVAVKEKLVTGTLTVEMDLNDCTGADADSSVKAAVQIKVTKGDAPVALEASYEILSGKGIKIGTLTDGNATVELTNGDKAVITGLPAGAEYTVSITVPEGYEDITTDATNGKLAASGSEVKVAAQEKVKEGQLYISASVKKADGTASSAKATVVITLAKTNAPVELAESYDILDENGTKIGSVENGTATLSLSDGDKAVIKGLPAGASYTVQVTAPEGYENKTNAAVTTGIIGTDSGAVACEVAEILKTGEFSVTAELKTNDGQTVTDEKVTVTVTLSKGLSPVALAESYDIVNAAGEKIGTVINGTATFKLASGEKATIKGLPQGTAYVVGLTAPEGYENTTTGATSGNVSETAGLVSLSVTEKKSTETSKDPSEETKPPVVNPDTGDTSGMSIWMSVMAASAAMLCLLAVAFAALERKARNRR